MVIMKVLGNSVARRDSLSCQETQLMDIIKILGDSVAKSDGKN
jgi:hypothetical protein